MGFPRTIRLAFYFLVGCVLGASVTLAHAGYALPSPPQGFSITAQGFMYRAPAAVAAANGAFQTGVSVNVAGKAVTMPAAMRFAANTGQFAAQAVRLNPWLAAGAVAAWLLTENIEWNEGEEEFYTTFTPPSEYPQGCWQDTNNIGPECFASPQEVCDARFARSGIGGSLRYESGEWQCYTPGPQSWMSAAYPRVSNVCATGQVWSVGYQACMPAWSPTTEADWDRLALAPLPFEAAEPIAREVPLPVQQPELAPVTEPLSQPYIDPVTGLPYRDVARISPAPTPESPFRVRIDTYREPMTSADPDAQPVTPTPEAPVEAIPEEQPLLCEEFPDASACAKLGSGTDPGSVAVQDVDVNTIQPVSIGATGGSCPADRSMQTQFGTLVFEWSTLCAFAEGVRPVILAMAWLVAGFGFFYGAKRSQ